MINHWLSRQNSDISLPDGEIRSLGDVSSAITRKKDRFAREAAKVPKARRFSCLVAHKLYFIISSRRESFYRRLPQTSFIIVIIASCFSILDFKFVRNSSFCFAKSDIRTQYFYAIKFLFVLPKCAIFNLRHTRTILSTFSSERGRENLI